MSEETHAIRKFRWWCENCQQFLLVTNNYNEFLERKEQRCKSCKRLIGIEEKYL